VKGADLERAVAAALQARGWFVMRNARDPFEQAFELDVLGYRLSRAGVESVVAEAKGGKKAHFTELWKLLGLKTHLHIQRGVLLANPDDKDHAEKVAVGEIHDVAVVDQDPAEIAGALRDAGLIDVIPNDDILRGWERCYRVEDGLIEVLKDPTLWKDFATIKMAKRQLQDITARVWLEPDPWKQAQWLYGLYGEAPKIGRTMANEMAPGAGQRLFNEALYRAKHPEIQACMYLEHRKRIMVAFAATRCALEPERRGWIPPTPATFNEIVKSIRERQAWHLPTLLQVYFLGLGGVIRLNEPEEEYALLASHVGCGSEEAKSMLALFDELFPYGGSWFYVARDLSRLKLMPAPIRGAGMQLREDVTGRSWEQMTTGEQRTYCGPDQIEAAKDIEGGYRRSLVRRLIPRSS
jgi:hypothetical protein